ncbi:hypothetical protein ERLG_01345 [Escherichia coli H263]|nr:hypothetical protein ERLG_01345 [Escherichia coli H263]
MCTGCPASGPQGGAGAVRHAEKPVFNTLAGNRQKQRRFDRDVTPDIDWLLQQGRTLGSRAKLPQKLDYLYRSCTGALHEQSDLFRLTYALESAKEAGFAYQLLSDKSWHRRHAVSPDTLSNTICLSKNALEQAFDTDGHQTAHLPVKIGGDIAALAELLTQCGWQLITTDNPPLYLLLTLINPSISAG